MTVASGSGLDVAEVGRNIPVAVFCETSVSDTDGGKKCTTHGFVLEALDEDAV
jgi:hypothetical protein